MNPRVIRNESQYEVALEEIRRLVEMDPPAGSNDAEHLEVLTVLVSDFERNNFSLPDPTPIEAVQFRMEQLGWTQRDLVPFIGSRSKVSEVLSGKRPFTLSMIRALHESLGIPLDVLVRQSVPDREPSDTSWDQALLREMNKRGWDIHAVANFSREFFSRSTVSTAFQLKQGQVIRSARTMDRDALAAWIGRILERAASSLSRGKFTRESITDEFLRQVVQLSWSNDGPLLAQDFLGRHGIAVIFESHLPRTYLDGAAVLSATGIPVIGLTLRHDRLDNFWFTLLHELVHVREHLDNPGDTFVDDLDYEESEDLREIDADNMASSALIPSDAWQRFNARGQFDQTTIEAFALEQHIHPAIIAGRIRRLRRNYRILGNLVGQGSVRTLLGMGTGES
jgi:HTH-type transcriptional regulator/antitoxin HigA